MKPASLRGSSVVNDRRRRACIVVVSLVIATVALTTTVLVPWGTRIVTFHWGIVAEGPGSEGTTGAFQGSHWDFPAGAHVQGEWFVNSANVMGNLSISTAGHQLVYVASGTGGRFSFNVPGSNPLGSHSNSQWYIIWIGVLGNSSYMATYMFGNTTIHQALV